MRRWLQSRWRRRPRPRRGPRRQKARGDALIVLALGVAWAACGDDTPHQQPVPSPCAACAAAEICLQVFDGTCHQLSVSCAAPGTGCPPPTRSDAAPCGGELPGAVACYGP